MRATSVFAVMVLTAGVNAGPPDRAAIAWSWKSEVSADKAKCAIAWSWANEETGQHSCGCDNCPCCLNGACQCTDEQCSKLTQRDVYDRLSAEAIKKNKPLLVSVNCDAPNVEGFLRCRWDKFPDVKEGVVVATPKDGKLWLTKELPCKTTAEQVIATLKPPASCPDGRCPR